MYLFVWSHFHVDAGFYWNFFLKLGLVIEVVILLSLVNLVGALVLTCFQWRSQGGAAAPSKGLIRNFLGLLFLHRAGILTDAGMCKTFLGCLCRSSSVSCVIFIVVAYAGHTTVTTSGVCHVIQGATHCLRCGRQQQLYLGGVRQF